MRFLLIEDDHAAALSIEATLKSERHTVHTTEFGAEGIRLARQDGFDLILLDLNLPDMNGLTVLQELRAAGIKTPIIIESGTRDTAMSVKALNMGADDYLTKPFQKDELLAHCYAVMRRCKGSEGAGASVDSSMNIKNVSLDAHARVVRVDSQRVHLTDKEYQILELLFLRKGTAVTKEMALNHLYGGKDEPELKIIDVFVCKLRKKLADAGAPKNFIETVWGRGYAIYDFDPIPDQAMSAAEPSPAAA